MNRNHLAMALTFLALAFVSAAQTRGIIGAAPSMADVNWADAGAPWLTPAAAVLALAVGLVIRKAFFARAKPLTHGPEDFALLVQATPGSDGGKVPPTSIADEGALVPTPHPVQESTMLVSELRRGDRVIASGNLYRGDATVESVEADRVKCRRIDGSRGLLVYRQSDLDRGTLRRPPAVTAAAQPAAGPAPAGFVRGDVVLVKGAHFQGEGTVQDPRRHGVVTVRHADGGLFSYDRADLEAGKLVKKPSAAGGFDKAEAKQVPPPARTGTIDLPRGGEATIKVGDIEIVVRHAK